MGTKEGKWKCSFCGAVNLGRHAKCQECNGVRGDDVEFFLDDDSEELTDQNLINRAKAGVDWSCDFCQTDNQASDQKCKQCGAPRQEGGIDRKEKIILDKPKMESTQPVKTKKTPAKTKLKPAVGIGILVGIVVVVALLLYFFVFKTTEETLVVESGVWERSIGLEEQIWVTKEDWDQSVPGDAQILSSTEKQNGTKQVQTGTQRVKVGKKDLGNGFFEDVFEDQPVYKEEPVYDTWIKYRVQEWMEYKLEKVTGTMDDPPAWPAYTLKSGARVGKKIEKATLQLSSRDKRKKYRYTLKPEGLKEYKVGNNYMAKINALGAIVSLEKK